MGQQQPSPARLTTMARERPIMQTSFCDAMDMSRWMKGQTIKRRCSCLWDLNQGTVAPGQRHSSRRVVGWMKCEFDEGGILVGDLLGSRRVLANRPRHARTFFAISKKTFAGRTQVVAI